MGGGSRGGNPQAHSISDLAEDEWEVLVVDPEGLSAMLMLPAAGAMLPCRRSRRVECDTVWLQTVEDDNAPTFIPHNLWLCVSVKRQ